MKYRLFSLNETYKIELEDLNQGEIKRLVKDSIVTQELRIFKNKFDGKLDATDPPTWEVTAASFEVYSSDDLVTHALASASATVTDITSGYNISFLIDYSELDAVGQYLYLLKLTIDTGEILVIPYYVEFLDYDFPYK